MDFPYNCGVGVSDTCYLTNQCWKFSIRLKEGPPSLPTALLLVHRIFCSRLCVNIQTVLNDQKLHQIRYVTILKQTSVWGFIAYVNDRMSFWESTICQLKVYLGFMHSPILAIGLAYLSANSINLRKSTETSVQFTLRACSLDTSPRAMSTTSILDPCSPFPTGRLDSSD